MTTALEKLKALKVPRFQIFLTHDFGRWGGVCPDCGGTEFLPGPVGGDNQNITCNGCGARLNIYVGHGLMLAQRIDGDGGPTIKLPKVG